MNPNNKATTIYKGATRIINSILVLSLILAVIGGIAYFFIKDVEYIWRWNDTLRFLLHEEECEIRSEIDGIVENISTHGNMATVHIQGDVSRKSYQISSDSIRVSEGDYVVQDSLVGTSVEWRAGILLKGLWVTLKASAFAMMLGSIIGIFGGLASRSTLPPLRWVIVVYTEIIRGIPLLWQIFIWYFLIGVTINVGLNDSGIQSLPPIWFGIAALACYAGANITQFVRDEMEAISNNISKHPDSRIIFRFSHLLRNLLSISPKLSEQFSTMIKDSSLLSFVAIGELTKVTRELTTRSLQTFEFMFVCAGLYFVVVFTLSKVLGFCSTRIAKRYAS
jgi:polar amino acid transport system permease protein